MAVIHLNMENFEEEVLQSSLPVLVDFSATWCGPCQMIAPFIEEIADENPDIKVGKVDIDESTPLALSYGVQSVPTLMVFQGGEIVKKSIGAMPKESILQLLD